MTSAVGDRRAQGKSPLARAQLQHRRQRGHLLTGCSSSEPCNGVQAFSKEMEYLDAKVPREVPVAWFGVASEVRLMGSFDGWTRGVDLSADDISDSVFTHFEATVLLLPVPSLELLPLTPRLW